MIFTNNCPKYEVDHMAVGPKMQPTCPKFVGSILEKAMATHSSIPAWKIPRTEEPGGLQSMGSQRVRQD